MTLDDPVCLVEEEVRVRSVRLVQKVQEETKVPAERKAKSETTGRAVPEVHEELVVLEVPLVRKGSRAFAARKDPAVLKDHRVLSVRKVPRARWVPWEPCGT